MADGGGKLSSRSCLHNLSAVDRLIQVIHLTVLHPPPSSPLPSGQHLGKGDVPMSSKQVLGGLLGLQCSSHPPCPPWLSLGLAPSLWLQTVGNIGCLGDLRPGTALVSVCPGAAVFIQQNPDEVWLAGLS